MISDRNVMPDLGNFSIDSRNETVAEIMEEFA